MKNKQGFIHIYTGDGKGKTTAAMGLALRAVGAGLRICFIQFLKGGKYSEHRSLRQLKGMTLKKFGRAGWVGKHAQPEDYNAARQALAAVRNAMESGKYHMVVADEILVAMQLGLIREQDIMDMMQCRPFEIELVLTGRGATVGLKRQADLVTEMKAVKHYYQKGILARPGIEY